MILLRLLLQRFRRTIALVLALSLLSAALGVGVIAFVNQRFIGAAGDTLSALPSFAALLAALFVVTCVSQIAMTSLGHRLVYELRRTLVKRVLDTDVERLETLGLARLLASLNGDTTHVSLAFVGLPALIYSLAVSVGGFAYLAWLSPSLFLATAGWLAVTIAVGWALLRRTQHAFVHAREAEDDLYRHYQAVIEGRKELALNRDRARAVYRDEFERDARRSRDHEIRADVYSGINDSWVNAMVLGAIGVIFFLAGELGWASLATATTTALTLLFLRTPLTAMVTAVPNLIGGAVALGKIDQLALAEYRAEFPADDGPPLPAGWQTLRLDGVRYRYPEVAGEPGFDVGPLDLTVRRGELLFVVGGNGSGKSTMARLLTGLYRPHEGTIRLDDVAIDEARRDGYRRLFSTVFADFHLFTRLLGAGAEPATDTEVRRWIETLELAAKARIDDGRLLDTSLSQGQRKRLALLVAALEQRPLLLLDEWAADQDPAFRRTFYLELLPALRAAGVTVVAITHDDHYFHVADRLLKMDGGKLLDVEVPRRAPPRVTSEPGFALTAPRPGC